MSAYNRLYRAVYIDNGKLPTYLPYAEKGKINLYYRVDTSSNKITQFGTNTTTMSRAVVRWFAGKDSADYVHDLNVVFLSATKTKKRMKSAFALLLKDNPQVLNKFITDDKYDFEEVEKIVHLYNTGEAYDGTYHGTEHYSGRSYLVTPKNDTVFCSIKNDYFTGKYMFKPTKSNDFTVIDSANAREFFSARDTAHFTLINVPGMPGKTFLKQLEKGKVNLYQKTDVSTTLTVKSLPSFLYISKGDAPLTPIMSGMYFPRHFDVRKYVQLKVFFNAIADNPGLSVACKNAFNVPEADKAEVMRSTIKSYNMVSLSNNETGKQ